MTFCKTCNEDTETLYSESRGEKYCTRCGAVLGENCIVEAVTFTEGANGVVRANGQFIPSSGFGTAPLGFSSRYDSRAGREQTLQRGYASIQRIANRLHLPLHLVEAAQRIYLMGVQRSFTLGRVTSHVAAACLYTSCRREKTEQLLIDFSDILCTPVRILGKVFVKLIRLLRIDVPTIDPSLFMERFASQLDFENKTSAVVQTAVRLVQAMARDWICTGRRPTGLCGAALLIAARFHGFYVSAEEISSVIRMASSTVAKRLHEFKHTSTARLTLQEFETQDLLSLPILRGPPCLEAPRKSFAALPAPLPHDIDSPQHTLPQKKNSLKGKPHQGDWSETSNVSHPPEDETLHDVATQSQLYMIPFPVKDIDDEIFSPEPSPTAIVSLADRLVHAIEQHVPQVSADGNQTNTVNTWSSGEHFKEGAQDSPLKTLLHDVKKNIASFMDPSLDRFSEQDLHNKPESSSLNAVKKPSNVFADTDAMIEESLSEVSDTEIDALLLTDQEREAKTLMWDEIMKDVMPHVHRRFLTQKRHDGALSKPAKKKRRSLGTALGQLPTAEGSLEHPASESMPYGSRWKNPQPTQPLNDYALESFFSEIPKTTATKDTYLSDVNSATCPETGYMKLLFA